MTADFQQYKDKHAKIKSSLPDGKNLAELQGCSRREKDANQIFSDKCREFEDQMHDFGEAKPSLHIKQNADMLKACQLFENGGNYSQDEIGWSRGQMTEIDNLFSDMMQKRLT